MLQRILNETQKKRFLGIKNLNTKIIKKKTQITQMTLTFSTNLVPESSYLYPNLKVSP